jgi:2'-5' RNA ligase
LSERTFKTKGRSLMIADPIANSCGVYLVTVPTGQRERPVKKSVTAAAVRAALSTNTPGSWSSDHRTESEKFTGWHYVGIHSIAVQAFQAELSVYDDNDLQDDGDEFGGQTTDSNNPFISSVSKPPVEAIENSVEQFPQRKPLKQDWLKKHRRKTPAQRRAALKKTFGSLWRSMAAAQNEKSADPLPDNTPVVKLLKNPNPSQSSASLLYECAQQLELTGTAIIVWIPNGLGNPCELYVVPTAVAEPRQPAREMPNGGYWINPAMARRYVSMVDKEGFEDMKGFYRLIGAVVPAEQCVIIRWPHPIWKDDGQSPIAASALWTDTADMADKARWGHLRRGPDPSAAVTLGEEFNPDQPELDRFAANVNNKYGGADKAGGIIVIPHGTDIEVLGTKPHEMAYGEAFTQMRDTLLAVHQVPSVAAGITDGGSFAAFVASLRQFITLKVQPMLSLIAGELTAKIAKKFGASYTVEIDATTVDDPEAIEKMLSTDIAAQARTVNEVRALRGLPPNDEWGNERVGAGAAGGAVPGFDANPLKPGDQGLSTTPGKDSAQFPDGSNIPGADGNDLLSPKEGAEGDKGSGAAGRVFGEQGGRRQWKRDIAAINDVMDALTAGKYTPTRALVMLQSLGLPMELATALVQDAKDGSIDDPKNKAALEGNDEPQFPKGPPKVKSLSAVNLKSRKLSTSQFNLTGALKRQVLRLGEQIDPRDLDAKGLEDEPHITVKYGLLTDDPREVKALLAGANPVQVRFGSLSVFEHNGGDSYDQHDVLKITVDSDSLISLHNLLESNLDHTTTFPDYVPHVTIGYLKPGRGAKYAEELQNNLEDQTATFDRLVFSDTSRNHSYLRLGVKAIPAAAKATEQLDSENHNGNGHAKSLELGDRNLWQASLVLEPIIANAVAKAIAQSSIAKTYDPSQERDSSGRWTDEGGGGDSGGADNESRNRVYEPGYTPTPAHIQERERDQYARNVAAMNAETEPTRIAQKISARVMSDFANNGFTHDHQDFRAKWGDLEDKEKVAVVKELAKRGMVDAVLARKRTPVTASTVLDSIRGQAQKHIGDHNSKPTNRHIPFTDTEAYRLATAKNPDKAPERPARASEGQKGAKVAYSREMAAKASPTGFKANALSKAVEHVERDYPRLGPRARSQTTGTVGMTGRLRPNDPRCTKRLSANYSKAISR